MGAGTVAGKAWSSVGAPIASGMSGVFGTAYGLATNNPSLTLGSIPGPTSGAVGYYAGKAVQNAQSVVSNAPTPSAIPNPGPAPVPMASPGGADQTAALRRLAALRMGIGSTFSQTGAAGVTAPALTSQPGLYGTGTKAQLGQ